MASLYELGAEYAGLVEAYDAAETEEEREDLLERLDGLCHDLSEKAEAYAKLIRNKEAEAQGFKGEIDRLTTRKRAAENLVERLKGNLLDAMKLTGQTEIRTSIGKWRVQMNPYKCEITDWTKIPIEFREPQPDKVDSKGIIAHYKATGEVLEGCEVKREMGVRFQ